MTHTFQHCTCNNIKFDVRTARLGLCHSLLAAAAAVRPCLSNKEFGFFSIFLHNDDLMIIDDMVKEVTSNQNQQLKTSLPLAPPPG